MSSKIPVVPSCLPSTLPLDDPDELNRLYDVASANYQNTPSNSAAHNQAELDLSRISYAAPKALPNVRSLQNATPAVGTVNTATTVTNPDQVTVDDSINRSDTAPDATSSDDSAFDATDNPANDLTNNPDGTLDPEIDPSIPGLPSSVDTGAATVTPPAAPSSSGVAILCARGTTLVTDLPTDTNSSSPGYYAIEEWVRDNDAKAANSVASSVFGVTDLPSLFDIYTTQIPPRFATSTTPTSNSTTSSATDQMPILFTGMNISHRDVTGQMLCLNNVKVFYSFGQNFGDVSIAGEILLGNFGDRLKAKQAFKAFLDFFWKYRVSKYLAPVTVSAVDESFLVYLVGIDFGDIIPDIHVLPFILHGTLIDIDRDEVDTINASGQVLSLDSLTDPTLFTALAQNKSVAQPGQATTAFPSNTTTSDSDAQKMLANNTSNQINKFNVTNIPGIGPVLTPQPSPTNLANYSVVPIPGGSSIYVPKPPTTDDITPLGMDSPPDEMTPQQIADADADDKADTILDNDKYSMYSGDSPAVLAYKQNKDNITTLAQQASDDPNNLDIQAKRDAAILNGPKLRTAAINDIKPQVYGAISSFSFTP